MKQTYFPHDSNARNDIKLIKLRSKHSYEGFGIYFAILELLFSENNRLCIDDYETLAFGLQCDKDILKDIITNYDLFVIEDNCFYSKRLDDTIEQITSKSTKASLNAKKRWSGDATAMQTHSNGNATAMLLNKSKLKKSKLNKIKKDINERLAEFKNSVFSIEGINKDIKESFIDYWSETTKSVSNPKMRWETEKTWSLNLRIKRWVSTQKQFQKKSDGINFPDYYDIHFAKRIEQDQNATRQYHKHLENIGYIKQVNTWNGSSKWIKK
tara:strand:- start:1917 stop:2723 length:807 start_codon:yes stop_codon:yes gene_type:complete